MAHAQLADVDTYIQDTILQSYLWDNMSLVQKNKVVGQSEWALRKILPDIYPEGVTIPDDILATQVMWVARIDDTILRAEVGMRNVWVDGTMITLDRIDTTIAPMVFKALDIPVSKNNKRRRTSGYENLPENTYRFGHRGEFVEGDDTVV
jgi:hypothetical protein